MTIVATPGPTPVPSEHVTIPPKRHRNFRIEDREWFALARLCEIRGERTSDVMRRLVRAELARHRKVLDADPVWQAKLAELTTPPHA